MFKKRVNIQQVFNKHIFFNVWAKYIYYNAKYV